MFNMSDLPIELYWTEKLHTFPFKGMSLDSLAPNPLEILPRQN